MHSAITRIASLALLWNHVSSFGVNPTVHSRFGVTSRCATPTALAVSAGEAANKYYNLEELEDKETCVTEVFLNPDGKVTVGVTDGPIFAQATGDWSVDNSGSFKMVLTRKYETGRSTKISTDMGEFSFSVERVLTGTMSHVGELVAVEGIVHSVDEVVGDREVGFFEMIDTTEARKGLTDEEIEADIMAGKKMNST